MAPIICDYCSCSMMATLAMCMFFIDTVGPHWQREEQRGYLSYGNEHTVDVGF